MAKSDKKTVAPESKDLKDRLLDACGGSVYKLCNIAAMRAMELNSGMKKLVDTPVNEKITTIAIKEIAEKKVRLKDA